MRLSLAIRSTRTRVAGFMVILFLAAFGVSGLATWLALTAPVEESTQARLLREASLVTSLYSTHSRPQALKLIATREKRPTGYNFLIVDAAGRRLDGDLPEQAYPDGLITFK